MFSSVLYVQRRALVKQGKKVLFHVKSSFHSWDNHFLTFQIFKCHDVIKCLGIKHETHFTETNHSLVINMATLWNITKENFLSKNLWKMWPGNKFQAIFNCQKILFLKRNVGRSVLIWANCDSFANIRRLLQKFYFSMRLCVILRKQKKAPELVFRSHFLIKFILL